ELRRLRRDLKQSQRSAYCAGTFSNLKTQFKAFFLFCQYFKLDPIPDTLDTVCLYVQFLSRILTPASIRNYLSGVKLLHLFTGADYPFTKDFILSLTLRGIARNALYTPRRAPPVTPSILFSISHVLDCEVTFQCTKTIPFGERPLHIPLLRIHDSPLCPVSAYLRMIRLIPARRSCPVF
ncbi:unnamed protein product, partial [Porites evermanni]